MEMQTDKEIRPQKKKCCRYSKIILVVLTNLNLKGIHFTTFVSDFLYCSKVSIFSAFECVGLSQILTSHHAFKVRSSV